METRELLESELRDVLTAYRNGSLKMDALTEQVSGLVAKILRLRTVQLLGAMKFVQGLEEINDALSDEGRHATDAERTQVERQLAKLETLLLGISAIPQDC